MYCIDVTYMNLCNYVGGLLLYYVVYVVYDMYVRLYVMFAHSV